MKAFSFCQFFISGLLLVLCGCSKAPIVQSSWYNSSRSTVQKAYEDPKERIGWIVSNDENRLYVQIRIPGQKYQQVIFREGLTLYVDTLGKKKEGCSFRVRNVMNGMMPGMRRMERGESVEAKSEMGEMNPMAGDESPRNEVERRSLTPRNFDEAFWKFGTDEMFINMKFEKTDFIAKSYMDQTGVLVCVIGIPLKEINYVNKLNSHKPMEIGLELGSKDQMNGLKAFAREGEQNSGGMRGGMRGGMGGGRGGMGGGPGGGEGFGGGPGGGGREGMRGLGGNANTTPETLWIRTVLCGNK
ncbi:MAG: hypothetical protein Q8859_04875 [Bacteroidota bacterium]|nr:hypothetical protein [Bacteroidota bacterium]